MPDALAERVRHLLLGNVREGHSRLLDAEYCNIQPSPEKYPFQFWWDTCFHVVMLCRLGETRLARRHLRSLFVMQQDDGFTGHMIYWQKVLPTHVSDGLQGRPKDHAY